METTITIMRPGQPAEVQVLDIPRDPGFRALHALLSPLLDRGHLERVAVLHEDKATDMFVDEEGLLKPLARNEAATAIYRNNWLIKHPKANPEDLPYIVGPAVLFSRPVWF